MEFTQMLLGFLYPPKCILCQSILPRKEMRSICRLCQDKINAEQKTLQQLDQNKFIQQLDVSYDMQDIIKPIKYLFIYEAEYRKAVLRWKYRGLRKYAKVFATLLMEQDGIKETLKQAEGTVIIPVPLAPSRMKKRGFNQALDLAEELSKLSHISVLDCLIRTRNTKPQASCNKEERHKNVKGSMQIIDKPYEHIKSIILIDDIYTTGSTIAETISVIKKTEAFRDALIDVIVIGKKIF